MPYAYCEQIGKEIRDISDEIPFEIPESWEWVRLGIISTYNQAKQKINAKDADVSIWGLDLEDLEKGGRLLVKKTVGERKAVGDKTIFTKGDVLYSKLRPYLLKILVAPDSGICTPEIVPFTVYGGISAEYIVNFLKSPYVDGLVNGETYGIKMPRAGTDTMISLLVPLPPLSEQHRIVAKIEQLLPFIEKYEQAETQLTALNTSFPEMLKKSILQESVQGKLVPQNPFDEPASVLLERIRAKKQELIKQGKIKKDKHESAIITRDKIPYEIIDGKERCIADEVPFELPDSWCWCRLSNVSIIQEGAGIRTYQYRTSGTQILTVTNILEGSVDMKKATKYIATEEYLDKYQHLTLNIGDIVSSCSGASWGKTAIWDYGDTVMLNTSTLRLRFFNDTAYNMYLYWLTKTPLFKNQLIAQLSGMQPNFGYSHYSKVLIPLPPLAEQHRIVAKIEEIMPMIERLTQR